MIFLVRDPRDVIVSSYFEMKNRGQLFGDNPYESRKAVFEGSLPEFIRNPIRRLRDHPELLQHLGREPEYPAAVSCWCVTRI